MAFSSLCKENIPCKKTEDSENHLLNNLIPLSLEYLKNNFISRNFLADIVRFKNNNYPLKGYNLIGLKRKTLDENCKQNKKINPK